MKIAILIPCYNVEKYLAECLDSVLAAGEYLSNPASPIPRPPSPDSSFSSAVIGNIFFPGCSSVSRKYAKIHINEGC